MSEFNVCSSSDGGEVIFSDVVLPALSPVKNRTNTVESNDKLTDVDESLVDEQLKLASEMNSQNAIAIRENWIMKQMRLREDEFTSHKSVRVFIGTWNVNGKVPREDLSPWLSDNNDTDIYAIGFQELDLSAEAFVFQETTREEVWSQVVESTLDMNVYQKVRSKQLVGMLLLVYVKGTLLPHVRDVQAEMTGTGIMGLMGNKGAVAIRFELFDTSVCFVNSHLAAGHKETARRNQDFADITRRTTFTRSSATTTASLLASSAVQYSIFEHDHLFWLGDLNYRFALPDNSVKIAVAEGDLEVLRKHDQLNIERAERNCFVGFEEGEINFTPTYKYDPGTDIFDTSEKQRAPAWCDRVLYRGDAAALIKYRGHMELRTSDHKPVSAIFDMRAKVEVEERRCEVRQGIIRDLDKLENECIPDATLSRNLIDFGPVKYLHSLTQTIELENVGHVVCQFRFIPKLGEKLYCRPWLRIHPPIGMIVPGEKAQIDLTIFVDAQTVGRLNAGGSDGGSNGEQLEDILILHLEHGKDYFISLTGSYLPTCFGQSIVRLITHPDVIRDDSHEAQSSASIVESTITPRERLLKRTLHVPKELWSLVDFLFKHGLKQPNLFLVAGNARDLEAVRDSLDTGASLETSIGTERTIVHAVAESLVRFLEAFPEPVLPFSLCPKCLEASASAQQSKRLLSSLPPAHYNVFVYVVAFLREVLSHNGDNGLSAETLALIFGNVMLRLRDEMGGIGLSKEASIIAKKKATFVYWFLIDEDDPKILV